MKHRLPKPLRSLYSFAGPGGRGPHPPGRRRDWRSSRSRNTCDLWIVLESVPGLASLIFIDENQGNWACATLLEGDDPARLGRGCVQQLWSGKVWGLVSKSLSQFLVTFFCLSELLSGSKFHLMDKGLEQLFESSKSRGDPLWTEGAYPNWEEQVLLLPPPRICHGR